MTPTAELPPRRILLLAPFAPRLEAAQGGARVIAELLCGLARRNDVALLYLRAAGEEPPEEVVLAACAFVEEIPRPRRRLRTLRLFGRLLAGSPIWVSDWDVPAVVERLRITEERWRPDIVQAEYHVMAQYLVPTDCAVARRIVDLHEPGLRSAEARAAVGGPWELPIAALERRAWRRYERAVVGRADAVVIFADEDRDALRHLADGGKIVRIPLGVAVPAEAANPIGSAPPGVLFVGSFAHPPNVEAARRLAGSIMPVVRRRFPSARLHLVGEQPPRAVRRLAGENVIVTGRVSDVGPYLDAAAVVAAPLRLGGGMRVKVLEALAAGKAVVASPLAAVGLEVSDGRELLLAETDERFAEHLCALLADGDRRAELGRQARMWAVEHLGWERSIAAFEDLYDRLLPVELVAPFGPVPERP